MSLVSDPRDAAIEKATTIYAEHRRRMWRRGQVFKSKSGWFCQCGEFMAYGEAQSIPTHAEHLARAAYDAIAPATYRGLR